MSLEKYIDGCVLVLTTILFASGTLLLLPDGSAQPMLIGLWLGIIFGWVAGAKRW